MLVLPDHAELPALREELRIEPGMPLSDGAPTWSIFDPLRHAYFQIGPSELALMSAWSGTVGELKRRYAQQQGHTPEPGAPEKLLNFLATNSLIEAPLADTVRTFALRAAAQHQSWWQWLLHHYLFVRIPLVRPDRFLQSTVQWVRPLISRAFALLVAALGLIGLYLVSRQWETFTHTFSYFFSFEGLVIYGLSLGFTKTLHELGHAYTATRFGCRVPTMGVAFLVLVPVLYTDTTDAWKLRSRKQRLLVDAAGVLTELYLACIATFMWAFLPDGPWRSAAFVVATTSWVTTLVINLSPFMRFDGYYFLSDFIGIPNLHARAQAFGQWRLREILFDLGEPAPEPTTPRHTRLMVLFAWTTWLYRFLLFLGIALVVYHFFFKALGLVLFAVEIGWFVVLPVWREVGCWWKLRTRIGRSRTAILLCALGFLLLMTVLPLDRSVKVPVILGAAREEAVYAPEPAQVVHVHVAQGQHVSPGQKLMTLSSPALEAEVKESDVRLALLKARLSRSVADRIDRASTQELIRSVEAEEQNADGLRRRRALLEIKAPFAGVLVDFDSELHVHRWITGKQLLMRVIDESGGSDLRGYVEGHEAWRVRQGARGRFVPQDPRQASVPVVLDQISSAAVESIDLPYLQSTYGGPIAVTPTAKGAAIPDVAHHAVILRPVHPRQPSAGIRQITPGIVALDADGKSLLEKVLQQVLRVLAREGGA